MNQSKILKEKKEGNQENIIQETMKNENYKKEKLKKIKMITREKKKK